MWHSNEVWGVNAPTAFSSPPYLIQVPAIGHNSHLKKREMEPIDSFLPSCLLNHFAGEERGETYLKTFFKLPPNKKVSSRHKFTY
jgi:hypothetical protein